MDFVHLRVQSDYSFLRSVITVDELANMDVPVLALTDNQLHGLFAFHDAVKKRNESLGTDDTSATCTAKAIYGLNQSIRNRFLDGSSRVLLIAKNKLGIEELLRLNTVANESAIDGGTGDATFKQISRLRNVFVFIGSLTSEVGELIARQRVTDAEQLIEKYKHAFGENVYFELQYHQFVEPWEDRCVQYGLNQTSLPLVLTNECVYGAPKEALNHRVLMASMKSSFEFEMARFDYGDNFYFKSPDEMQHIASAVESKFEHGERVWDAYSNTAVIAAQVEDIDLSVSGYFMPDTPNASQELRKRVYERIDNRYPNASQAVIDRIEYELKVIDGMGFSGYFDILDDILQFAMSRDIDLGPGRGSAAGSAVMYTLNVTDVEPMQYDLLFERFLNPERITMPDVDVDVDANRRSEIINYIVERFGEDKVAQIASFSELGGKSSFRLVCEAFGVPPYEKDRISKLIQEKTIAKSLENDFEFIQELDKNPDIKPLVELAQYFDNKSIKVHAGLHAAGVVISSVPLEGMVPIIKGKTLDRCVGIDMAGVESRGLIKYDILGLKLLTAFRTCFDRIGRPDLRKLSDIPLDDPKVFEFIATGQTAGLFQLSKAGSYCKDIEVSNMDDIIAINALNRPGPKQFIPNYIKRKFGRERANYFTDKLKPILEKTYGIIIYQEQIQQLAVALSGYTLGQADLLRRAVSKKKQDVIAKEREHFVNGAVALGYDRSLANAVYDFIVPFAEYGFNKSHATAYAILAYCTAWLKLYYPTIFLSAMIEAHSGEDDEKDTSPKNLRIEAELMGISFLPPDVNRSDVGYVPDEEAKTIRFGLRAVKGCGDKDATKIVQSRPFNSFKDFIGRANVGKGTIKSLAQAGAFDAFEDRSTLLPQLEQKIEIAKEEFTIYDFVHVEDTLIRMSRMEYLKLEREVLGAYVSGHPMELYEDQWKREKARALANLGEGRIKICGVLTSARWWKSRQGVHVTLEDGETSLVVGLGLKVMKNLTQPIESLIDAFVIIDANREGERLFGNKMRFILPDQITETKILRDSPELRMLLKQTKRGSTQILVTTPTGVMESLGQYAWTRELDELGKELAAYTA